MGILSHGSAFDPIRYYVVEPLEEGGHQIWRVGLVPLTRSDLPDEDGVIVSTFGIVYVWKWEAIGSPFDTYYDAKRQALRLWYP